MGPEGQIVEIQPGRFLLSPGARPRDISQAVAKGEGVQFDSPLPDRARRALAEALSEHPDTELYVYGHYGETIDQELRFLDGLEDVRYLSLNLHGLRTFEGLARFDRVERLTLQGTPATPSLAPLGGLTSLEELRLGGPVRDAETLSGLTSLRFLSAPATQPILDALTEHPAVQRLDLHFGSATELAPLTTLPSLRDLRIWQVKKLDAQGISPLAEIPRLEALALGALRNVRSLEALEARRATLRYVELEKLPNLETLAPLGRLTNLRALCLFDSRPVDRSLEPLKGLRELDDLTVGDVYPASDVEDLFASLRSTRISCRGTDGPRPSRHRWRGLLAYVDAAREQSGD